MYIFSGSNQPYLVAAGENVTISSNDKDTVRLPCQVSSPDIYVYLQQEMNVTTSNSLVNTTVIVPANITTGGTNVTVNGTTTLVNTTITTVNTTKVVQVPVNVSKNAANKVKIYAT